MASAQRPIVISGNWKMNHDNVATQEFFDELKELLGSALGKPVESAAELGRLQATVYPPFLSLPSALLARLPLAWLGVGAQNVHWMESGAYTGEVSTHMLDEIGVRQALVGHSERRQCFGETDETVRLRTERCLQAEFEPTVCIGETRAEREAGRTEEVLLTQILGAFAPGGKPGAAAAGLDGRVLIAYEPVWAIGTGLTATPAQAQAAHAFIRRTLKERFGAKAAEATPILYGGSIKPDNLAELLACPDVDGGLIGGASLKAKDYFHMLSVAAQVFDRPPAGSQVH